MCLFEESAQYVQPYVRAKKSPPFFFLLVRRLTSGGDLAITMQLLPLLPCDGRSCGRTVRRPSFLRSWAFCRLGASARVPDLQSARLYSGCMGTTRAISDATLNALRWTARLRGNNSEYF